MSASVFQRLQAEIIDNVTLNDLIPKLNGEGLLTQGEEERLTNSYTTEYDRKLQLTQILRTKGPNAPSIFVRCLRQGGNPGHTHLAGVIDDYLAGRGNLAGDVATDQGRGPGAFSSSGSSEATALSSGEYSQAMHSSPNPPFRLAGSVSNTAPHTSQPSRSADAQAEPLHLRNERSSSSNVYSNLTSSSESLSSHFGAPIEEHAQPSASMSSRYTNMVRNISTSLILPSRCTPFDSIKAALCECVHESSGAVLAIPNEVSDVATLLEWLHAQRMCHEYDVDLLCALLQKLNQLDLCQEVRAYAEGIMHANILSCRPPASSPTPGHFLAFTFHNCPSLTFAQACEVKDVLSNLLGIDRHAFWLSGSENGSIVLGWSLKEVVAKRFMAKLEDESVREELVYHPKMHNIVQIEMLFHGSTQRHTVFSAPISTSGQLPPLPSSLQAQAASSLEPCLVSRPSRDEGEVSSTTTGALDHALAMDVSLPPPEPTQIIGAKRRLSADSTQPDISSDVEKDSPRTTQPRRAGPKRPRTAVAGPPPPKRKALQSAVPGRKGVHLMGMSPGQFSQQYSTSSFQKSERDAVYQRANQQLIVDNLNLLSILPRLNAHSLLTMAENEEMELRAPEREKIMKLVTILAKKGEEGFHRFIAALEEASDHLTHSSLASALKQYLTDGPRPALKFSLDMPQVLINHLKAWYSNDRFYYSAAGPHIRDVEFIRLALVTRQGVSEEEKWKDKFLKATLHGHVEDIVKRKRKLDMSDIFRYGKRAQKSVLVEGAPGVGKTMLAMNLCVDWAQGKALQEYDIVLFVELRRFQGESKLKLETVLSTFLEQEDLTKKAVDYFIANNGERLLIILEGWDELPPELRRRFSWFLDLIEGKNLPKASVMVTSRPSVTAPLYDYMDERRIEVLGFDEKQQNEYIDKNIQNPMVAQRVRDHLKQFPNLRALAHIPLTLAIICSVATDSDSLPITLTELYDKYTCKFLFQNLRKSAEERLNTLIGLESLEEIPEEVRKVFLSLCKLALDGFKRKAFIFKSPDLEEVGLPSSTPGFDGYGLLTTTVQSATAGKKLLYQFRHLSIQEFFAGSALARLPDEECSQLLTKFRTDQQFRNIWKFLAGITKLRDRNFCCQIVDPTRPSCRDQLFLLHCLYEAQNPDICHRAADKINRILHLDNTALNATDCLCAAYVMGSSEGKWEVNLRGCNIGGDGLEVFKWQLMAHDSPQLKFTLLDLTHNQLDAGAMTHLAEMLVQLEMKILRVKIESNMIGDEGVRELSRALKTNNTSLIQLQFRTCGLTSESARWFAEALRCNSTFNNVYFGFDNIGDEGARFLSEALCHNSTLEELGLANVGLTAVGLIYLKNAFKTNHTLKVLRIDRNKLGTPECHIIADILRTHQSLELIDISRNPIGDDGLAAIMEALIERPDALKKLGAFGCGFSSLNFHMFIEFFQKSTVFKGMNIGLNPIGDTGAKYIALAVEQNKSESVKEIYMEDTGLSDKGKELITKASQLREDLTISYMRHAAVERIRERINEELHKHT